MRSSCSRLARSLARANKHRNAQRSYSREVPLPESQPTSQLLNVSTLPNGVRVATESTSGHSIAAGVYIDAGSRYESERWRGCSHLVDRMSFKSTRNRTAAQMSLEIEALGGQFVSSSSRETIMYEATSYSHSLPALLSVLADTALNPLILPEELEAQAQAALWEIQEIKSKPEMMLPEVLHEVAWRGNTLGNPLLCPEDRLTSGSLDADTIRSFMQTWFRPERIVVAGAGVPHEQLLELANKNFGHLKATPISSSVTAGNRTIPNHLLPNSGPSSSARPSIFKSLSTSAVAAATSSPSAGEPSFEELASTRATYTGGSRYIDQADLEFAHLYVGFEGLPIQDDAIYALATLQVLLGGGGSFSAGGPGKGLYSRLYTSVLNQHHAVDFCSSFHHCYMDSGLFGISISVLPNYLPHTPHLVADQLDRCRTTSRGGLREDELSRARNQLKSSLVMALESRMVQVEDLGRQVQVDGKKVPVETMLSRIDAVTLQDVRRVAEQIMQSEPTIVAQGKLNGMPDVRDTLHRFGLGPQAKH